MLEADLALLKEAAAQASQVALTFTGPKARKWDKDDGAGPVTEADLAVNECLLEHLRSARPDYGWLSEETPDDAARLSSEHVFIIDPIDGTRSFIEGSGTWAISIAIARRGVVEAGVVALPARDFCFAAAKGLGATCNDATIKPSLQTDLDSADVLIPRPSVDPKHWNGATPSFERHHRPSLAYRLCLIASGRFDAMVTLRDTWEWDIAAGSLIASEAGCSVTDKFGAALAFNNPHPKTKGVTLANPELHDTLLKRLSPTS